MMMMIDFITLNSGLVPLIGGLCAQILYCIYMNIYTYIYIYICIYVYMYIQYIWKHENEE